MRELNIGMTPMNSLPEVLRLQTVSLTTMQSLCKRDARSDI